MTPWLQPFFRRALAFLLAPRFELLTLKTLNASQNRVWSLLSQLHLQRVDELLLHFPGSNHLPGWQVLQGQHPLDASSYRGYLLLPRLNFTAKSAQLETFDFRCYYLPTACKCSATFPESATN